MNLRSVQLLVCFTSFDSHIDWNFGIVLLNQDRDHHHQQPVALLDSSVSKLEFSNADRSYVVIFLQSSRLHIRIINDYDYCTLHLVFNIVGLCGHSGGIIAADVGLKSLCANKAVELTLSSQIRSLVAELEARAAASGCSERVQSALKDLDDMISSTLWECLLSSGCG